MENLYRPSLPSDPHYLADIHRSIAGSGKQEDIRFEYLIFVTDLFDLPNPYDFVRIENFNTKEVVDILEGLYEGILAKKDDDILKQKLYQAWDYLAEKDEYWKSDLIFVFGWPAGIQRANEAIRLYKTGYADKILFTGQKSSFMSDIEATEAEFYRDIALEAWVPEEDIILEPRAINTPENVIKSVEVLKERGFFPKRIIGVTLNYHMKRAYLTFRAVYPWEVYFQRSPIDAPGFERESYFLNKKLLSYVYYEYIKLYGARLMKHF